MTDKPRAHGGDHPKSRIGTDDSHEYLVRPESLVTYVIVMAAILAVLYFVATTIGRPA